MRRQDNVALGDVVSMQQLRLAARALQRYRWRILAVLLTIAVDATFTIVFYYGMKLLIDAAVGSRDQGTMVRLVAGLGAFYIVTTIANVAREYLLSDVEARLATDLRLSMLTHLQQLGLDYYRQARSSDLLARFSTDVTAIKNALTKSLPTVIRYTL